MLLLVSVAAASCGRNLAKQTEAEPRITANAPVIPTSVQMWLGTPARNFYGSGPWPERPLRVIWEFETDLMSGRLHREGWGGLSWPGQPSLSGERVYFGSADGYLYCLDTQDGSLIWSFKAADSLKTTPTIAGNRVIASGLDHYVYCLNANDGSLIWKYKTGFEVDSSAAVINGRVYFGGEDGFFYCLSLEDGALLYKTAWLGSMEGSFSVVAGRIYIGTEQGDLYCLEMGDGSTIWKSRLGADSDSTPAVADGLVYTAAENGYVYCFKQADGELVWKFKAEGGLSRIYKERSGFWASPVVRNGLDFVVTAFSFGAVVALTGLQTLH